MGVLAGISNTIADLEIGATKRAIRFLQEAELTPFLRVGSSREISVL